MKRTLCFLSIMVASFAVPLWCSPSVKAETEYDGPTECVEDPHYYACPESGDNYYDECYREDEYYYAADEYCPCYEPNAVDTATEEVCPAVTEDVTEDVAEDVTEDVTEDVAEDVTEDVAEDVDYWYDGETEEYYEYDFCDDPCVDEMTAEEPVATEASPFQIIEETVADAVETPVGESYDYDDEWEDYYNGYCDDVCDIQEPVETADSGTPVDVTESTDEEVFDGEAHRDAVYDEYGWYYALEESFEATEPVAEESVTTDEEVEETEAVREDDTCEEEHESSMDEYENDFGYEQVYSYEWDDDADTTPVVGEPTEAAPVVEAVEDETDDYSYDEYDYYDYYGESEYDGEYDAESVMPEATEEPIDDVKPPQEDLGREALLSIARTLDQFGRSLQGISRQLTEIASEGSVEARVTDSVLKR